MYSWCEMTQKKEWQMASYTQPPFMLLIQLITRWRWEDRGVSNPHICLVFHLFVISRQSCYALRLAWDLLQSSGNLSSMCWHHTCGPPHLSDFYWYLGHMKRKHTTYTQVLVLIFPPPKLPPPSTPRHRFFRQSFVAQASLEVTVQPRITMDSRDTSCYFLKHWAVWHLQASIHMDTGA